MACEMQFYILSLFILFVYAKYVSSYKNVLRVLINLNIIIPGVKLLAKPFLCRVNHSS